MAHPADVLETVVGTVQSGGRAALCVIVATRGSTPQPAGVMVCVDEQAKMTGTLGGGCVEADIRARAREALQTGENKLLTFELDYEFGLDEGMICGGVLDVAVCTYAEPSQADLLRDAASGIRAGRSVTLPLQVQGEAGPVVYRLSIEAPPKLLIVGGGHIGRVLAEMAAPLGFDVTVVDDRSEFANAKRFAPPIKPIAGNIAETLAGWPIDGSTYIVIVTRGHRHDERALAAVYASPAKFIGMIGSRRKVDVLFKDLKQDGATSEQLARVHAPIGLNISAVTVEEIVVSICAQLVSVRRADYAGAVQGPIPLSEVGP